MLSAFLLWEDAEKIEPDSCVLVGQETGNRTRAGTHEFLIPGRIFSLQRWLGNGAENWRPYGIYKFGVICKFHKFHKFTKLSQTGCWIACSELAWSEQGDWIK